MTSGRIVTSERTVAVALKKWEYVGGVVARKNERCDDVVGVDGNVADNSDVVDGLTDGVVEEEFHVVVDGGFSVVIIVEAEELASVDVVIHEIVEE